MRKIIISDTSCFIILSRIGEFNILFEVYGNIVTTKEIALEFGEKLPEWVEVKDVKDKYSQKLLEMQIDKGESSAIALALETAECTLILDDYKARRIAEQLSLSYTGTIGVIIKAKQMGIISSIKPILYKIKRTDFRLSSDIEYQALQAANEL